MKTIAVFSSAKAKSSPENVDIAIELIHSNISLKNVFRMITYEDHGTKSITEDIWRKAMEKRFPIGLVRFTPVWKHVDGGRIYRPENQDMEKTIKSIEELSEMGFAFVDKTSKEIDYIEKTKKAFESNSKQFILFSIHNYSLL